VARLRAPGWPWLLAHELRLSWRSAKASLVSFTVIVGIFWVLLHVAGWFLMRSPQHLVQGQAVVVTGLITWFLLFFALATAFGLAVVALFERGDLDLLLSSPIPPRTVFAVRGLGVALQSVGILVLLWSPFADGAAMHGHWRMLAGYPVLAAAGLGATALAFAATLALVRAFGVRRAKVIAQVLAAVVGAGIFLASQAANMVPGDWQRGLVAWMRSDAAKAWLGPESALWFPARAMFGDPVAAIAMLAAGVGLFTAVIVLFERRLLEGTRESEGPIVRRRRGAGLRAFRSGLGTIVVVKELRLLWRDPRLISQTLLQVLYLFPLVFVGLRHGRTMEILAAAVILITTTMAGNLAWMTVSGEEAPDLIGAAPVAKQGVLWLKVAAALVAPVALGIPFLVVYAMQSWSAAVIFTICFAGALTSSAVVQAWNARPGSGRELRKRMQSGKLANLVEFVGTAGWASACFALLHGTAWGLAGIAVGLAAPALAWLRRPDPLAQAA
jgi:ABC-2 type transport system permease protein